MLGTFGGVSDSFFRPILWSRRLMKTWINNSDPVKSTTLVAYNTS